MSLAAATAAAIDAITPRGAALVVVDVDEVVLRFVAPLAEFLAESGHRLRAASFALTGTVTRAGSDQPIAAEAVKRLIDAFFAARVATQEPHAGAVAALARLAELGDVVLLTNVPFVHAEARARRLAEIGIRAPMIANDGPKGPALARLAGRAAAARAGHGAPVYFIDDGPTNLVSAREAVAGARLVHFVGDPQWFALAPDVPGTWLKARDWDVVAERIAVDVAARTIAGGGGVA